MLNMFPKEDEEANLMYLHAHIHNISVYKHFCQGSFQVMAMQPVKHPG